MPVEFAAEEIFEMAIQMERNGAVFYREAANRVKNPEVRQLLRDLAEMEDKHEEVFAAMKANLSGRERTGTVFDPDNQTVRYLQAMVEGRVFGTEADPAGQVERLGDVDEIFAAAIGKEKDSIVFYLGMKELVPERLGKDKIEEIIREEMSHITLLSQKSLSPNQ